MMEIENLIRYPALAVGLMEIENLIRYTARAVGLKPPAMRGLFLQRSQHLLLPAALTTGGTPDILAAYGHGMPCPCSHHQARR